MGLGMEAVMLYVLSPLSYRGPRFLIHLFDLAPSLPSLSFSISVVFLPVPPLSFSLSLSPPPSLVLAGPLARPPSGALSELWNQVRLVKTAVGLCTVAREGGEDGRGVAALQTEPVATVCVELWWWWWWFTAHATPNGWLMRPGSRRYHNSKWVPPIDSRNPIWENANWPSVHSEKQSDSSSQRFHFLQSCLGLCAPLMWFSLHGFCWCSSFLWRSYMHV